MRAKLQMNRRARLQIFCAAMMALPVGARISLAATGTWIGASTNSNWDMTNTANWSGSVPQASGDAAFFNSGNGISTAVNLDQSLSISTLTFNGSTAASWVIGSSNNSSLTLGGSATGITINNSSPAISAAINVNLTGAVGASQGGGLQINAGLSHSTPQTLILGGSNNFTGDVELSTGDLALNNQYALAGISAIFLDVNSTSVGNQLGFNASNINLSCNVVLNRPTAIGVNGVVSTISGVVRNGSTNESNQTYTVNNSTGVLGTLILTNPANTNTNGYTIGTDTRLIGTSNQSFGVNAAQTITVTSGGTLAFQGSAGSPINYQIPETISINNNGANDGTGAVGAIQSISGNNSFPGNIAFSASGNNVNGIGVSSGSLNLTGEYHFYRRNAIAETWHGCPRPFWN